MPSWLPSGESITGKWSLWHWAEREPLATRILSNRVSVVFFLETASGSRIRRWHSTRISHQSLKLVSSSVESKTIYGEMRVISLFDKLYHAQAAAARRAMVSWCPCLTWSVGLSSSWFPYSLSGYPVGIEGRGHRLSACLANKLEFIKRRGRGLLPGLGAVVRHGYNQGVSRYRW